MDRRCHRSNLYYKVQEKKYPNIFILNFRDVGMVLLKVFNPLLCRNRKISNLVCNNSIECVITKYTILQDVSEIITAIT